MDPEAVADEKVRNHPCGKRKFARSVNTLLSNGVAREVPPPA
jgi:hypothetical protein